MQSLKQKDNNNGNNLATTSMNGQLIANNNQSGVNSTSNASVHRQN